MYPSTLESLKESLADWQEMKCNDGLLARLAGEMIDEFQGKIHLLEYLLGQYRRHGIGLTLKHHERNFWGILLPDASEPGSFRWQGFQHDGFTGHCTYKTPELCLGDMLDFGLCIVDLDALARMSCTQEWARGMEITSVIQQCNAGLISYEEAQQKYAEINARYKSVA